MLVSKFFEKFHTSEIFVQNTYKICPNFFIIIIDLILHEKMEAESLSDELKQRDD